MCSHAWLLTSESSHAVLGAEEEEEERKSLRNGVHHADAVVWEPV